MDKDYAEAVKKYVIQKCPQCNSPSSFFSLSCSRLLPSEQIAISDYSLISPHQWIPLKLHYLHFLTA